MFADPETIVKEFHLKPGVQVADLGAGIGAYTFPLAKAVSPDGKVYACEVQKDLLTRMRNDASSNHITNIEFLWTNIEKPRGTKLGDRSMDAVVVANVLFQVEDKPSFLQEIYRILKTGGEVFCIDWSDSFGGMGPHPEQLLSKAKTKELFTAHGFVFARGFSAASHHYGLVFHKK